MPKQRFANGQLLSWLVEQMFRHDRQGFISPSGESGGGKVKAYLINMQVDYFGMFGLLRVIFLGKT